MKLLLSLGLATVASANIIFDHVPLDCSPDNAKIYHGCLRGQLCLPDGTCVADAEPRSPGDVPVELQTLSMPFSTEKCGASNGGTICDRQGTASLGEPKIEVPSPLAHELLLSNAETTTDGTCGSTNGVTVCGNWPQGNCCSLYGLCGSTSAHCGSGCRFGSCLSAAEVVTPPLPSPAPLAKNGGTFTIVGKSGVPAMHAGLMPNGRVFFLDKVENYTELVLPDGYYAYSSEYNPADNTVVPLPYGSNAFCSGGTFLADGRVVSLGGNAPLSDLDPTVGDGFRAVRYLSRSSTDASLNGQSWSEPGNKLDSNRWYPSAQTLPDGRVFVASGSLTGLLPNVSSNNNPTYEILSPTGITEGSSIPLAILEKNQPYYLYPFIHLLRDDTLLICVAKSCDRFSVANNTVLQSYADIPGDYRTYPNTGGSVLLPLSSANSWDPDVIFCGGGVSQDLTSPTDASCARMDPLSPDATWEMDSMPEGRVMVEGVLLLDGTVLWLNGGSQGAQGFPNLCADPALEALLYTPSAPLGQRWSTLASSTIPRLYHSCAILLLDGTVMVSGSNPVAQPVLVVDANNPFITEFRVEIFTPPYLQGANANRRPTNVALSTLALTAGGDTFGVSFNAPAGAQVCGVVLYHGGYITHSLHMGQRMLLLDITGWKAGATNPTLTVTPPPSLVVSPPGPYVVYVVCDGVPAIGQFVMVA